jgi:hypothetical protein
LKTKVQFFENAEEEKASLQVPVNQTTQSQKVSRRLSYHGQKEMGRRESGLPGKHGAGMIDLVENQNTKQLTLNSPPVS